jgi:hypothetical protein
LWFRAWFWTPKVTRYRRECRETPGGKTIIADLAGRPGVLQRHDRERRASGDRIGNLGIGTQPDLSLNCRTSADPINFG